MNNAQIAVASALNLVVNNRSNILVGTEQYDIAISVLNEVANPFHTPLISGSLTTISLRDTTNNPYFLRTIPSAARMADGIAALLDVNAFSSPVALIYRASDINSLELSEYFIEISSNSSWYIARQYIVNISTNFDSILSDIYFNRIRIGVLFFNNIEMTAKFFSTASQKQMAGSQYGYQWIVDDTAISLQSYRVIFFFTTFLYLISFC
jgi:ABC-type branched-subunit amino acid transport system substrate-binding protein